MASLLLWRLVLVSLVLLAEELPPLLWLYAPLVTSKLSSKLLTLLRALLLALVALPLLVSLASPVALDSQVVEVVSLPTLAIEEDILIITKHPLLDSLGTSLPLQLDSPETLSSRLPASTLVVPLLLGSSPLREDRLCRRWIPRVNLMV